MNFIKKNLPIILVIALASLLIVAVIITYRERVQFIEQKIRISHYYASNLFLPSLSANNLVSLQVI